jgi:hypothetical protein
MDVLFVGDSRHCEFASAIAWLGEHAHLQLAENAGEAEKLLAIASAAPRLIVLAQARPGQIRADHVERLCRQAPLARLVALLGSWCEGETRSGRPWPGVPRFYWYELVPRLSQLLSPEGGTSAAIWSLPRSATDAERMLAATVSARQAPRGAAAIFARRHDTFAALAEACDLAGLAAVWARPATGLTMRGASLALWDSSGWGPHEAAQLAQFVNFFRPAPTLALLDFPRLSEQDQAFAAGAGAVISKPFLLECLLAQLEVLVCAPGQGRRLEEAA